MEPDQLKKLREKINTMERQPVSWQKEFVWQQVEQKANISLFKIQWRYAAALVLAGVIGYFILYYQQRVWESAAYRISILERQIESAGNKPVTSQNSKEEICIEEKNNIILTVSPDSRLKNPVLSEDLAVIAQEPPTTDTVDSLITSTTTFESIVSVEDKPQLKTIIPIIGKIPQNIPDRSGKERTVRIRLNKKDIRELPSSQEEGHVLVARIN